MIDAKVVTHSQIAKMLRQRIKLLQRCSDDPIKDLGETNYFSMVQPLMIFGVPGIGKTMAIRALAKELDIGYTEFRLNEVNYLDIAGLPYVDDTPEGKVTAYARTKALPSSGNEKWEKETGFLVLDEFPTASDDCRSVALRLMDSSRAVGTDYKLPSKCIIICMGNGEEDGGINYKGVEPAALSRCKVMRLEPSADDWLGYARTVGVHPTIISFIQRNPEFIYKKPLQDANEERIGCSPRIWSNVSGDLYLGEGSLLSGQPGKMIDDTEDIELALTALRSDVIEKFKTYYMYQASMIPPEDVVSGKWRTLTTEDGTRETTYLTIEYVINRFTFNYSSKSQKFVGGKEKPLRVLDKAGIEEVCNYIKFLDAIRKVNGADAMFAGIERLVRIPYTGAITTFIEDKNGLPKLLPHLATEISDMWKRVGNIKEQAE